MEEYWLIGLIAGDGHIERNGKIVVSSKSKKFIWITKKNLESFEDNNHKVSLFFDSSARRLV